MQVKLLSATAKAPTRGSAFAAGYDLYAAKETTIPARGKALVATDISIAVPAGTYGRVAPRSGLASKHSIDVGAGVIDADYRGPLGVLLFNFSDVDFRVTVGERIAQLIVERVRLFFPCSRCCDIDHRRFTPRTSSWSSSLTRPYEALAGLAPPAASQALYRPSTARLEEVMSVADCMTMKVWQLGFSMSRQPVLRQQKLAG